MLKIKAPIQTKVNTPFISTGEDFSRRIIGNYELFDLSVTGEDFLHLLTRPPEVFLMEEGGVTNIYGETNISDTSTRKIEVINNFLNRIILSDTVGFTYQDRVFITDVLHKLGITETSSFMKRVENIMTSQQDFSRQLSAYWNYNTQMRELVEEYITHSEDNRQEIEGSSEENYNILHQDIFKRLQTGALYQIISNFHQDEKGVGNITQRELLLSEQKETAEKILLQSLINEVRGEELPLIYRNDNYYEEEAALPQQTDEDARSSLTAATLLSLIRSVAVTRREENFTYPTQWYQIAENIYRSQENTLQRITENLHQNMEIINENGRLYISDITNEAGVSVESGDVFQSSADITNEMVHVTNVEGDEVAYDMSDRSRSDETTVAEGDVKHVSEVTQTEEVTRRYEQIRRNIDARTSEIEQLIREEGDEISYDMSTGDSVDMTAVTEHNVTDITNDIQQADITNIIEETVNNEENLRIHQQLSQNIEENNKQMRATYEAHLNSLTQNFEAARPRKSRAERERAQKEALKHPELFMQEFREESAREEARRKEFEEKRAQLALTQSPDAFTLIQQFLENPSMIPPGVEIKRNDIGSLIYDNKQVENSYRNIEKRLNITEETENEIIEREVEKLKTTGINERQTHEEQIRQIENLSLIHKTQETGIDEELLEAITRQRQTSRDIKEVHTTTEHHETDERVINTVIDKRLNEQQRLLEDLIQEDMNRQMNNISEKVYRKIEKRLANERSRRGV